LVYLCRNPPSFTLFLIRTMTSFLLTLRTGGTTRPLQFLTVAQEQLRRVVSLVLALLLLSGPLLAAGPGTTPSLAQALNPDGTLRPDATGSFDARQFQLSTAPDGAPVFRPLRATRTTTANQWSEGFGLPGTNGLVLAVARFNGSLYVGGTFTLAGNVGARNIARWDGTTWHALGTGTTNGVNDAVNALTVFNNELYVGGRFTTAGGLAAPYLARWNGTDWSPLSQPIASAAPIGVTALATQGSSLYVGGSFSVATAQGSASNVARWDGTAWHTLGSSSVNGQLVTALAVSGTDLYVGGNFTTAGGASANKIARWDGSAWYALGTSTANGLGSNSYVYALAAVGSDVYVGGVFDSAAGVAAQNIAHWDGTAWHALGTGSGLNLTSSVLAIAFDGTTLYAGGFINTADGVEVRGIARWDGSTWTSVGPAATPGVNSHIRALHLDGTRLYAVGSFSTAGGTIADNVAVWNSSNWSALPTGATNGLRGQLDANSPYLNAVAIAGSDVYVGGSFIRAGSVAATNVARWDGRTWHSVGAAGAASGPIGNIRALAVVGNSLYVGGNIQGIDGQQSPWGKVVRWDGTAWSVLPNIPGVVHALATDGTQLFVGGEIVTLTSTLGFVGRWDGNAWTQLGNANAFNRPVRTLLMHGTTLYAGGDFTTIDGQAIRFIASWDGNTWSAVGTGMSGPVRALAASGSMLYAAGGFTTAGSIPAFLVARWDGSTWAGMGTTTANTTDSVRNSPQVNCLAIEGSDVYVGGQFGMVGGVAGTHNLARWDGSTWHRVGPGLNGQVRALASAPTQLLYAGGDFSALADNSIAASAFGIYDDALPTATAISAALAPAYLYPNPARTTATLTLPAAATARPVLVLDAVGRAVYRTTLPAQASALVLKVAGLPAGLYTVRCASTTARLVLE
jgi:hypothetical protein